jgi:cell wall-active antibiotic response 4TMS protein YvqF
MSSGKLVFGILLVGIGALLLAGSQGWLPSGTWSWLVHFWPILLVILGVILLASVLRNLIVGILSATLVIGAFVFAGWWITHHVRKGKPVPVETIALGGSPPGTIIVRGRMICGSLTVAADPAARGGIRLSPRGFTGDEVAAHRWSVSKGIGVLSWPVPPNNVGLLFGSLDIGLPVRAPVRLDESNYLSSAKVDYTALRPDPCDIQAIGSRVLLTVAGVRPPRIHVHGFLSSVEIRLPANCPARVEYSSPLTAHSFPDDFVEHLSARVQGRAAFWTANGTGTAVPIVVDGPLMSVHIVREPVRGTEVKGGESHGRHGVA